MEIKSLGPVDIVAPTKNEEARIAYNIGSGFLEENRLDEAEKCFIKAIALDPLYVDAMDHLGLVYRRQNRLSEAEGIYKESIEINKKNKVPYQNLSIVYRVQNRLNDVFELQKKMLELDPNDPEPYFSIGELFLFTDDYENAMAFNDKAIELYINQKSPYIFDAFYHKGLILYAINEFDESLKYLEEARKGNPNNERIENSINEIKRRINKSKTNIA